MTVFLHYLLPVLISFCIAALVTPWVRRYAIAKNILDRTNTRIHVYRPPTPKLGGIPMFVAFLFTTVLFLMLGYLHDSKISTSMILWILGALLILMIGGYLDDRYTLRPWQHMWFPLAAAGLVVFGGGIDIGYVTNPFLSGNGPYGRSLLYLNEPAVLGVSAGSLLAVGWLLFTSYATKFLDGIEGLVSGLGTIAAVILFFVSLLWDVPLSGTSTLVAIFCGSVLGVWIYNVRPLNIFLGDSGPLFIGFMLGTLSIISGAKIATTVLVFGLPLLDAVFVVIQRLAAGKNPFRGDRRHLHFRLLDRGWSQKKVLIFYYLVSFLFGVSALFLTSVNKVIALGVLGLLVVGVLSGVVRLGQAKKENR